MRILLIVLVFTLLSIGRIVAQEVSPPSSQTLFGVIQDTDTGDVRPLAASETVPAAPPAPKQTGAPDTFVTKRGKVLYKSYVIDPLKHLKPPPPKAELRHSKERVLTPAQAERLTRIPIDTAHTPDRYGWHGTQKALLEQQKQTTLNNVLEQGTPLTVQGQKPWYAPAGAPSVAFALAFTDGKYAEQGFELKRVPGVLVPDVPQVVSAQPKPIVVRPHAVISRTRVRHHLTVRHPSPTLQQRAQVSALRAASRTLRRINDKRRGFKRALRALRVARDSIEKRIHQHHVNRARVARRRAAILSRRAAWSALLRHRRFRKKLRKRLAKAFANNRLTPKQRRLAIAHLLRESVSEKDRRTLHRYLKHLVRRHNLLKRVATRKPKARKAKQPKRATKAKKATKGKKAPKKGKKAPKKGKKGGKKGKKGSKKGKKGSKKGGKKAAAKKPLSKAEEEKAVQVLIARIKKSILDSIPKHNQVAKKVHKRLSKHLAPKGKGKKAAAAPAAKKAAAPRFAQVEATVHSAASVEAEALAALTANSELDAGEDALTKVQAQVDAAQQTTQDWFHDHNIDI